MKKQTILHWVLCISLPVLFSLLLLLPRFQSIDASFYDIMLSLRPKIDEDPQVLLLNVDDGAINRVGTWPWSRSILADGLIRLGEFGAHSAIFDIEYVDPSPMGVSSEVLNQQYPQALNEVFNGIDTDTADLFGALQSGQISLTEAESFIEQLSSRNQQRREQLLEAARAIARDNDDYHGRAAALFGSAYYTTTMLESEDLELPGTEKAAAYAREHFGAPGLRRESDRIGTWNSIQPVIYPIGSRAAGAGFPNVPVDSDGVRRRIELLQTDGQQVFAQLSLRPLLDYLQNPDIILRDNEYILQDAVYPNGDTHTIRIPRSVDGTMMINWPPNDFDNTFRQESYSRVYEHDQVEGNLIQMLEALNDLRVLERHQWGAEVIPWLRDIQQLRLDMFDSIDRDLYRQYIDERAEWYPVIDEVLQQETLSAYTDPRNELLERDDLPEDLRKRYSAERDQAIEYFELAREDLDRVLELRERLHTALQDAFVIIGWTGVSTTDIGVNPFDEQYMNVGTHAAVANTILQRNFLVELPYVLSIALALLLTLGVGFMVRKTSARRTTIIGFSVLLTVIVLDWLLFAATGMYLRPIVVVFSVAAAFIGISLLKFYFTEGEKRYISGAFSRYLSQDVVKEILDDPSMLNLGGEKRELTALFTDVKGFSTISEQLDPQDLVSLLNRYLSAMSDIILELGGTIDKYEGDAIIAFFGAPLPLPDHAYRACLAAARMKEKEGELNRTFLEEQVTPQALQTRIGINSGDMVVGNMGTERKMDYTMMGHHVNLAARLEGVNKQYGSWILASEATIGLSRTHTPEDASGFIFRRLDRVRVVGVREPVRLFEVIDEASRISESNRKMLEVFEDGLELFEQAAFQAAMERFQSALEIEPEDGPATTYLKRCKKFIKSPPPPDWDGVFSLTQK